MMFPRKCLWPATWMRHTPSAEGITRFPVSTVIIPLWRGSRKQPFLHFPWQWFKFSPVLVIKWPERKIWGLSVSNQRNLDHARKVGWSLHPQPSAGHPGDWWRAITHLGEAEPCLTICLCFSNRSRKASSCVKRRGLVLLMWPSTPVCNDKTLRETQDPAGNGEAFRSNLW